MSELVVWLISLLLKGVAWTGAVLLSAGILSLFIFGFTTLFEVQTTWGTVFTNITLVLIIFLVLRGAFRFLTGRS